VYHKDSFKLKQLKPSFFFKKKEDHRSGLYFFLRKYFLYTKLGIEPLEDPAILLPFIFLIIEVHFFFKNNVKHNGM